MCFRKVSKSRRKSQKKVTVLYTQIVARVFLKRVCESRPGIFCIFYIKD